MTDVNRRVSRLWSAAAAVALVLGAATTTLAIRHQIVASRPIGEGELFAVEAQDAADALDDPLPDAESAVRALRNRLTIEAVSIVDAEGTFIASTSPNFIGTNLASAFLLGASGSNFRAVTLAPHHPIQIDGVTEWGPEDVLYQVAQPLDDGRIAILAYDVAELTARRANSANIRPVTLQLGGVGMSLLMVAIVLLIGRSGAKRRIDAAVEDTRRMAQRAEELSEINRTLDEARAQAETALGLAEEKIRIRSEFVLMINHELRTPLTGVVTSAELLLHDPEMPIEERSALLGDMVREGERLRGLISRMLTVARVENRGLGYNLRAVPLSDITDAVAADHSSMAVEGAAEGIRVTTDPEGLAALVSSLADNAMSHGAHRVTVRTVDHLPFEPVVEVGNRPDRAYFVLVVDDGPGIDPVFLPRIFEKFEKSSPSSGTGLGLYLARMMVEAMNGSLGVATGPDGTTMAIGMPVAELPVGARR